MKLNDAINIRDRVLKKLSTSGRLEKVVQNFPAVCHWSGDGVEVIYRSPFQKIPKGKNDEKLNYVKALIKQKGGKVREQLPYGLDVWSKMQSKVLNIEWNESGQVDVIKFRRGPWEKVFD
jgi:hypothetical protein